MKYLQIGTLALVALGFGGAALGQSNQTPVQGAQWSTLLDRYCVSCHNERMVSQGTVPVAFEDLDVTDVESHVEIWEHVVRKLRADAMPPPGRPRPDVETRTEFISWLETVLDRTRADDPNPGRPVIHRLNRAEYVNVIRDLLGLEINGRSLLPGDNSDVHGFDNNAEVLSVSPMLIDRYLSAARKISRLVVGRDSPADLHEHRVHKWMVQEDRMSEELPFGSRGGAAVPYFFPVEGEYEIQVELQRTGNQHIRGLGSEHQLDMRLDGALIERFTVGGEEWVAQAPPESYSGNINVGLEWEDYSHNIDQGLRSRVQVKAGRHVVGVSFVAKRWELEGVIVTQPQVGVSRSRNEIPDGNPSVATISISGPLVVTGVADETVPRRKIFVCRPTNIAEEPGCARKILSVLARRAYRRPVTGIDVDVLMEFYAAGRAEGSFDIGIQRALERLLISPQFLFRIEQVPESGRPSEVYRISDLELASRLSFFLWSSMPDDALLEVAERGGLQNPAVLEREVRRMLDDTRATALVENFVGAWLAVRNVRDVLPDSGLFPEFDENLREAFQRETELLVESMLREDKSLVDLIDADYTFVNERLAKHYGIDGVYGNRFRRVSLTTDERRGLLGHGSVLTVTSYPNRTSPVLRGKWLLENLLGAPPPAPPPDIPALAEDTATRTPTSVRERLELHRRSPACAACHERMDPLGFALEHFDPIGGWRTTDARRPIDALAVLPDGTRLQGSAGLRSFLLSQSNQFVRTVTEKLMTYALGRDLHYFDAPAIRQIVRAAETDDYRWSSVILEIVRSMPFQMRRAES